MRIFNLFEKPVVITEKNYQDFEISSMLEKLHYTDVMDDRSEKWEEEKKRFQKIIENLEKGKKWEVLTGITDGLNVGHYGNLFPDYLLKIFSPFFFKKFPNGKIWFLPFNENSMNHFMTEEAILAKKYEPSNDPFVLAQSLGIDFDAMLNSIGLEIPMFVRFPYLQGSMTGSTKGVVCFVINDPISIYGDRLILHEKLLDKTKYVYTDSTWEPFSNPRHTYQTLDMDKFSKYFDWYIESLNQLYDFVLNLPDLETKRLVSFSLARICFDTYLIQIIEQPYLRKMLFFTLLDKYANLIPDLGSSRDETEIWRDLLSHSFFDNNFKNIAEKVPESLEVLPGMRDNLQRTIGHVLHSKYEDWSEIESHEEEAINFLRTYRNSHHGYLIRNRSDFFKHTGDIPNHLPDYSLDLWHTFLADPKKFVEVLK